MPLIKKKKTTSGPTAKAISHLEPGAVFETGGKRWRLDAFDDDGARVTELNQREVGIGEGKTKTIEYGVATWHWPVNTEIS